MLAHWLAREPMEGVDLNKGILMVGNVGTGKTLLFRAVRDAMRASYGAQFGIRTCSEMVRSFADEGYEGIEDWILGPHVCFDDLGAEQMAQHFGNKTDLMAEVIEARYDRLSQGRKCWTHFSTNLGTDQIETRYGARAASRLRQMCNLLDLGAGSAAPDRRASASAIKNNPIPVNADNVYSVVHPTVISRLSASFPKLAKEPSSTNGTAPTREQDMAAWIETVKAMSTTDRDALRLEIMKMYHVETARPYREVLDQLEEKERA